MLPILAEFYLLYSVLSNREHSSVLCLGMAKEILM